MKLLPLAGPHPLPPNPPSVNGTLNGSAHGQHADRAPTAEEAQRVKNLGVLLRLVVPFPMDRAVRAGVAHPPERNLGPGSGGADGWPFFDSDDAFHGSDPGASTAGPCFLSGDATPTEQQCRPLTVEEIVADFASMGIVGETDTPLAIYLVGTSRLLDEPLSAIVWGPSSSGKSFVVSKVGKCFPGDHVIQATKLSPQALYPLGSLAHKFVIAGERSRMQDDAGADATAALRQLQSEGKITKYVCERNGNSQVTRRYEVVGPISYVETTTLGLDKIFPEDLNRALVLTIDESDEQTRAVLRHQASRCTAADHPVDVEAAIIEKHHRFQASLLRRTVAIPFAERLMEELPAGKVEMRRIGQQVLSMIKAVALLHQHQRQLDEHGRVIATVADYVIAARVLKRPLASDASLGVSDGAADLLGKLLRQFGIGYPFTTTRCRRSP